MTLFLSGHKTINTLTSTIKRHPFYTTAISLIALYGLLGFFLVPYLLEKNLVETLQKDFDAELRIDKIEFNPFALSLRVNNLALDNPGGEPTARIEEVFANFQLSSIFSLALTFDQIRFTEPEFFISRNQDGEMDFSYLTQSSADEETAEAQAETPPDNEDNSLLPLQVHQFAIENLVIHWADQVPLEAVKTRLGPIAVDIKDLNTLPNQSGQQTVVIATQDFGTLSWTGDLQLNPFQTSARASLKAAPFELISTYIRQQAGIEIVDGLADIELNYQVGQTEDKQIKARIENFNLTLSDIVINSFADGSGFDFAGEDQQIVHLPELKLADGLLLWPEQTVSLASISLNGLKIDTSRDNKGVFNLEPRANSPESGDSSTSQTVTTAEPDSTPESTSSDTPAENEWQVAIGALSVNDLAFNLIDQSVSPAAQLGINEFNLKLTELSNQAGARFPMNLSLTALNGGKISLNGGVTILPQPAFDFELGVDGLQLAVAQPYIKQQVNLKLDSGAINLQGKIESSLDESFAYNGNFEVTDLVVAESIKDERLVSWKNFSTDKIAFSLSKRQLEISQLLFDQLYGDVLIDREGSLNVGQIAKGDASTTETAETEVTQQEMAEGDTTAGTKEEEFSINIGGIELVDASADFADMSLPLPFAVKINSLNGKMTTISNQSVEPSEVSLEGKVDEFGLARINGVITPLDPKKNTDILLTFENIDIPKFTPYSIQFAGREISEGSLDLKLGYQIKDSQLVAENGIVLRDFELGEEVPHPGAMDVPLGLAVALLKDASGKIAIDLPITGDVDNPEFEIGGVVLNALGDLLVKIVLSPFTLLGNLLGIEADELESVSFLDGRSDLTPPQIQKAGKLVEALALRPELQLVIKGVSAPESDKLALQNTKLDETVEQRIAELTAASDPSIQYPQHRKTALEQLAIEQLGEAAGAAKLTELEAQYTTQEVIEGQTETKSKFDSLAYVASLKKQLVVLQELDASALDQLAEARASALQAALLSQDETLQPRIVISDNISVTPEEGEPIEMPITLSTASK